MLYLDIPWTEASHSVSNFPKVHQAKGRGAQHTARGPRGVYPKGIGRAISHIFWKWGVDGLVILGFDRLLLVMPTENGDYLKLVLPYVYVNST